MFNKTFIHQLVEEPELVVPTLFKPIQFKVLQKLDQGEQLTNNEQRYLRGNLKRKLTILQKFRETAPPDSEFQLLLNFIGPYYITGVEALKHNGYGWFYDTKVIEVINTKIIGSLHLASKIIKFIRLRNLHKNKINVDSETGLHYATNDQILRDTIFTKNEYVKSIWIQMHQRYSYLFSNKKEGYHQEEKEDLALYGM